MHSRHMFFVVLVVIAAVAWVGRLTGHPEGEQQLAQSTRAPVTTVESTSPAASPSTSTPPASLDEVQRAALAGVAAWQDRDAAARNSALALLATPDYAAALSGVDPAVVPACTADEVRTDVEADGLARVNITCRTGLVLDVDLSLEAAVWRVFDIAPGT